MLDIVLSVIGVIILTVGNIYVWSILLNKKLNLKNFNLYFSIILLSFVSMLSYNNILKFTIVTITMCFLIKLIFKESIKTSIVTSLYTQILNALSELIFSIIGIFILKLDFESQNISIWIILFADLFVSICGILITKFKFIRNLHKTLVKLISNLGAKQILLGILPIIFVFNAYLEITYYKIDAFYVFLLNNVSIYIIVIIILILARKENEYTKIYDKYNTTLNSLKEYEDILDKYKVSNHENKNQLLTIRNMSSNKKIVKYIDELVKNKIKDDERIMQEVSVIPVGGLRGLVYSKVLDMKEKAIEYELNISKDVRTVDLINKLDDSDMLDICQIIGVYIDNAIEAVLEIEEKYVNVEMYLEDNNLVFEISNYYEGKIELDKLEQKGYTTKSTGHGYGLTLTKEIIENNKKLMNEKRLSKEIFTQVLKVKMD